ncbi:uncharacterized protein BXZ73DRAFT_111251 [Epithele typhae]|uniref:uncharacterized protein n=1 Tax=Epithele typhae TaxID=378194 RepID=UPI002007EDA5|nr:uncharacterized protein BXZ73DRAFT_111251 [Epithele typhae]KAH9904242.1 hypothetical protein BXZ73DRAFT_111251 [Epithele typhae]
MSDYSPTTSEKLKHLENHSIVSKSGAGHWDLQDCVMTFLVECDRCVDAPDISSCEGHDMPCDDCKASNEGGCTLYGVRMDGILQVNGVGAVAFFDGDTFSLVKDMKNSTRAVAEGLVDFALSHMHAGDWHPIKAGRFKCPFETVPLTFEFPREHARMVAARAIFDHPWHTTHVGCKQEDFEDVSLPRRRVPSPYNRPSRDIRPGFIMAFMVDTVLEELSDSESPPWQQSRAARKRVRSGSALPEAPSAKKGCNQPSVLSTTPKQQRAATRASTRSRQSPSNTLPSSEALTQALQQWDAARKSVMSLGCMVRAALDAAGIRGGALQAVDGLAGFGGREDVLAYFRDGQEGLADALRLPNASSEGDTECED